MRPMEPRDWIRERALTLGFHQIGFACAPAADEEFAEGERFGEWLERGLAGDMGWLERTAERRVDPHAALAGVRGVVALGVRYPGRAEEPAPGEGRVAAYARGRDYHNVLGRRLRKLARDVRARWPEASTYASVDTGAILEKAWAARAGLGWIGKNTMLIDPERGSFSLLAILFTTLDLGQDPPITDQCGSCRLCLDACPTDAFPEPFVLDARRCISYLTIELRDDLPTELRAGIGDRLFGCDECQDVCPFNLGASDRLDPGFGDETTPLHEPLAPLLELDADEHAALTRGRPLARPGRDGLVRNACVAAPAAAGATMVPALARRLSDPSASVRRHAAWALDRIGGDDARAALDAAPAVRD